MDKDNLLERLEKLNPPTLSNEAHQHQLKMTIMNAKRSSRLGFLFVLIPAFFLLLVMMSAWLNFDTGIYRAIESLMSRLDKDSSTKWIFPLLYLGGPLATIIINLLAISHISFDKKIKELTIVFKYRRLNVFLIAFSILILSVFFIYLLGEATN